jgi:hypothetical protein
MKYFLPFGASSLYLKKAYAAALSKPDKVLGVETLLHLYPFLTSTVLSYLGLYLP